MKKFLIVMPVLAVLVFGLVGVASADDCALTNDCSVVGLQFLGPNQNDNPANFIPQIVGNPVNLNLVSRNYNNDFFLNGRHIELPEFKTLGINEKFVLPGVTVLLTDVVR